MQGRLVLVCTLLGLVAAQVNYVLTRIDVSADYSSSVRDFKIPAGSFVSTVRLYPYDVGNSPSTFDALAIWMDVCYSSKQADGSWSANEVCSPGINSYYQKAASAEVLHLAPTEYITQFTVSYADWDPYFPAQMGLTTSTGRSINIGGREPPVGSSYYARSSMSTQYAYHDYSVSFNNADRVFAGYAGGSYYDYLLTWVGVYYTASSAVCGDGIVQAGEQCDSHLPCCTSTCQFANSTVTCRAVAGLCDFAEMCTGTSETCPTDAFRPKGTACGAYFGMCDVLLEQSCTGTSPQCYPTPSLPSTPLAPIADWNQFNVLSFNTFTCNGGDVEGRLAVRHMATLSGFDLGLKLNLTMDGPGLSSLFVGGDASWSDGEMHPDTAQAYVGGTFTGPTYLASRVNNQGASSYDASFGDAFTYYSQIQAELASIPTNVAAQLIYGDGLQLTCAAMANLYHVAVDASVFNSVNWYSTVGCQWSARWIIDITGIGSVSFQGAPFPGIVERVIYNVLGSGRAITANNGVAGHILAPSNSFNQAVGVTYGQVVVGDVIVARQNNKPNCINFQAATISTKVMRPVSIGDRIIYVSDLSNLIVGDRLCVNGDCQIIEAGQWININGVVYGAVSVSSSFRVSAAIHSMATTTVTNPASAARDTPLAGPYTPPSASETSLFESSAALIAPTLLVAAAALF